MCSQSDFNLGYTILEFQNKVERENPRLREPSC
jgi:hypothetical protein